MSGLLQNSFMILQLSCISRILLRSSFVLGISKHRQMFLSNWFFGNLKKALDSRSADPQDSINQACSSRSGGFQNSNEPYQSCGKCLRPGHVARFCRSSWRCKACFKLGHKARWCLMAAKPRLFWAPKVAPVGNKPTVTVESTETNSLDSRATALKTPAIDSPSSPSNSNTSAPVGDFVHPTTADDEMANFPCNPMMFTPEGCTCIMDGIVLHVQELHLGVSRQEDTKSMRSSTWSLCLCHSKLVFFLKKSQSSCSSISR